MFSIFENEETINNKLKYINRKKNTKNKSVNIKNSLKRFYFDRDYEYIRYKIIN